MKTRKKTKLCLQCNGVNPMSASNCAYCGAMLAAEEIRVEEAPQMALAPVMEELFPVHKASESGSYHAARVPDPFVQSREPLLKEDRIEKPLYTVFDQPQAHQMGRLSDAVMENPQVICTPTELAHESLGETRSASTPASSVAALRAVPNSVNGSSVGKQIDSFIQAFGGSSLGQIVAVSSLIFGLLLAAIGLAIFLFSHEGKLVLSWRLQMAPWLLLFAAALTLLGWRTLGVTGNSK